MARPPRSEVFDRDEVGIYHCINRCVRRCFLCGFDPFTQRDYAHRKGWIQSRLEFLAAYFAIDVLGFAIMGSHFHLLLRNRPDVVQQWSPREVARRWLMLCPERKTAEGMPEEPNALEISAILDDKEKLAEIRSRLSDISWFMKMVAEPIAKRANAEDQTTGRFWQGRFRMRRICDDAALMACLIYVDLNPIRAQFVATPEASEFTSAKLRIDGLAGNSRKDSWLSPLEIDESAPPGPKLSRSGRRCSDKGVLPISLQDYLSLLDWTGRQVANGKSGSIPTDAPPILQRLGINTSGWLRLVTEFENLFFVMAGSRETLAHRAHQKNRRWYQAPGGRLLTNSAA